MSWIERWISRPERWRTTVLLAGMAFVPRLMWVLVGGPGYRIDVDSDAFTYDKFARLMLSGWGWVTTPLARREPLYPAFMALAYILPGDNELFALQLLQVLLGAATTAVLYLGLRGHVRPPVAFFSALLVAWNPHFVYYTILGYRENLIVFFLAATIGALLYAARNPGVRSSFLLALVLTLLAHTDVRFLPLSLGFPVLLLILQPSRHGFWPDSWRPWVRQSAWLLLALVVLMIPYQVRCYAAMGYPVVITDKTLGQWLPLVSTRWQTDPADRPRGDRAQWLADWTREKEADWAELSPEERRLFEAGARPSLSRAGTYLFHFADYWRFYKPHETYRPYPDGRFNPRWSTLHNLSSTLAMIPFFLLAPFAWWHTPPDERRVVLALACFLGAHMLLHIAVHALERYRIPMEVVTATLTAVGLVNVVGVLLPERLRLRRAPAEHEASALGH